MAELLTQFNPTTILLVLLIGIPAIVNFITWCKKIWAERVNFAQKNFNEGRKKERSEEQEESRFSNGEARISALETAVGQLTEKVDELVGKMNLYLESDQLDIKAWLKDQHEKWMHRGCIDSHSLDLVNKRFAIYTAENGNGWAKKMVEDINGLPVVTSITSQD